MSNPSGPKQPGDFGEVEDTLPLEDDLSIGVAPTFTAQALAKGTPPPWSDKVISEGQYAPGELVASFPSAKLGKPDASTDIKVPAPAPTPIVPPKVLVNEPSIEPCHITWRQAEGKPESTSRLDHLPDGLAFPDDFPEPIHYDPQSKRLFYRGFMDTNSYRFLQKQSHDLDYIRAIDELNINSGIATAAPAAPARRRSFLRWLLGGGAAVVGAAAWAVLHHHH